MATSFLKRNYCKSTVNIVRSFQQGFQLTGEGRSSFRQLHLDMMCFGNGHFETNVLLYISKLDTQSIMKRFQFDEALRYFKLLLTLLNDHRSSTAAFEDADIPSNKQQIIDSFIYSLGQQVLQRFLMTSSLLSPEAAAIENSHLALILKSFCVECLYWFCVIDENTMECVSNQDDLLQYLFFLLQYKETCIKACEFIEHMLLVRKDTLNLSMISNLPDLVQVMDDLQLANFCRILAVTISNLDLYENRSSLYAQNKQKRSKNYTPLRDINQDVVLSIPNLLPRLVELAAHKPYIPRFPNMMAEIDHWMQWIDNHISDDLHNSSEDEWHNYIGGVTVWTNYNGHIHQRSSLSINFSLSMRVEVVYVLSLLLDGKLRKKVQKQVADLCLIPKICDLFDFLIWKHNSGPPRRHSPGHSNSCECSPEVALKIQLLRLIHSFCDHSEYKHLMLSSCEFGELKRIMEQAENGDVLCGDDEDRSLMCKGNKGLLTKIVEIMSKESPGSSLQFWLSRAVESYLRGTTLYADQIFLIRRGLLMHIVNSLLDNDGRHKEILQSSFDLLGELLKFNVEAFMHLEKLFDCSDKFKRLVSQVNRNLVDSNMFIRSLVLSLEHIHKQCDPSISGSRGTVIKKCKVLMHVANYQQRIKYLYRLISVITVHNLTQENISCLNTTLVFLMFAHEKGELEQYLTSLRQKQESSSAPDLPSNLMQNFRELLLFWQEHYLHKDKDCSALEKNSRISFDRWIETVKILVDGDMTSPMSLLYYIQPEACTRNN